MKRLDRLIALCLSAAALVATEGANAQSGSTEPHSSPWAFTVTPYFWLAGLEGDVGVGGLPPAEVDASFSDIIENTDIAVMLGAEARRDRWGLTLDLVYLGLAQDAETPGPLFDDATIDVNTMFTTIGGAYRFIETTTVGLDALAGARLWYVDAELDLDTGLLPGRSNQDNEYWVDPVVGLRAGAGSS